MLKDISSLKIQGANFSSETILPILKSSNGKYAKVSILYGRNGSGKSTIAKAFRKIKGETVTTVSLANVLDAEEQSIDLSETDCNYVFVFDEDFITANVRIEERGLGSIVMLGEQADLTVLIEQAEKELKKAEDLVTTTRSKFDEYNNNKNQKAPKYYIDKMKEVLRKEWASRDSCARGLRQNSSVSEDTYTKFITLSPEKSKNDLIVMFNAKKEDLKIAKSGTAIINSVIPSIPDVYKNYSITEANKLIKEKIEKPELSDREKFLFSLVTNGKAGELQEHIDYLNDEKNTFCPYCLQDLTSAYKNNLINQIQKLLTKQVKEHQIHLKELMIDPTISLDLSPFSALLSYQTCVDLIATLNDTLTTNNALLQRKINDSYSPIIDKKLSEIGETITLLNDALKKHEEEKIAYNQKAIETKTISDELKTINDQIAYYDVISYSQQLDIQNVEMEEAKQAFENAIADRDKKKNVLENLNSRRKNIDIAIDFINNELKYIFFAENRLTLEHDGDFYKLLSNGHPVLPKDISVGERNIIGLCYFFTSIMRGKNKDTAYNDEYLIIIDDPVSSYDFENKVGILSFLKYKIAQFLNGNVNSRTVVMTHDLQTFFDIEKICQELSDEWKNNSFKLLYTLWELENCSLKQFEYRKRHEYTELIRLIYEYGNGEADEYDFAIGNMMRQALEAFATFVYKKGIEQVSTDEMILSGMCDKHKSYFKNLMYRIVLHNGSHREEQVRSMEIDFLSIISETEKRRTARDIICFIYILNKAHILAHLGNVSAIVDKWCEEIKSRSAVI